MAKAIFWHRRDLRIHDNIGLNKALSSCREVQPIFIFDTTILESLPANDQRVVFIHSEVSRLKSLYQHHGSDLHVHFGDPVELLPTLVKQGQYERLYTNRDYEPYARKRDKKIFSLLEKEDILFIGTKDHVIFEKNEVIKDDGKPYTVFTPYAKKWKVKFNETNWQILSNDHLLQALAKGNPKPMLSLEEMGFISTMHSAIPPREIPEVKISTYGKLRDFPALNGTSRLSIHLRFGTISIRELALRATEVSETFLNELIWRDFYQMIIYHFPLSVTQAFKPIYDLVEWENNEEHFKAWCEGKTGYPLVDAGMRELNETGFMHNRVRMVVASFLTKHLLIDWRWGEAYFAQKLMDFELASNVGGWQWAASSGCDAAPYFRVFNPTAQQEKFDKQFIYIRQWIPEYGTNNYPNPIIDHVYARNRVLERYKNALKNDKQ
jgi:deoxyribodipyrimidine photo-lyase